MYKTFLKSCLNSACVFAVALVFDASALIKVVVNGDGVQTPQRIAVIRDGFGGRAVQPDNPAQFSFGDITLDVQPTMNGTSLSFTSLTGVDYKCLVSQGVIHLSPELGHTNYLNQTFSFSSEAGITDDMGANIQTTYDNMMFSTLIGNEAAAPAMPEIEEEENGKLGTKEKVIREALRVGGQVKEFAGKSGKKVESAGREVRRFFKKL